MAQREPRRGDVVSGGVLAGLGVYIVWEARRWEYLGADGPGPGFFPLWYGVAMLGFALLLVATNLRAGAAAPAGTSRRRGVGRALATWAAVGGCAALIPLLGFLLAFALLTLFVVAVMYRRPWLPALAVAVGCAVAFYLLFPIALNVALPRGVLGF